MLRRTALPLAIAAALVATAALAGCSSGGLPGGAAAGAGGGGSAAGPSASAHVPTCTASGTSIPAGKYAGKVTATLDSSMKLTIPGAGTISNAGSGKQGMNGTVTINSNGSTVTGTMSLSGLGYSKTGGVAGTAGTGSFVGTISGAASAPVIDGTMKGEWDAYGPLTATSGHSDNKVHAGLHVTNVACAAVTGDVIAMFAEIAKPVAQYITLSGTGTWTATRK
jgi:hypothetical protein